MKNFKKKLTATDVSQKTATNALAKFSKSLNYWKELGYIFYILLHIKT
jgi:hypothetical protein